MLTFKGKDNNWESFIFQFDRVAARQGWSNAKEGSRLVDSFSDRALEFAVKLRLTEYQELVRCQERRFNEKDPPSVAHRKVTSARQKEDKSIEEFSQRIYFLTVDAYPEARQRTINEISVEAFLRGCRDKHAAEVSLEKEPQNVEEALRLMKSAVANHKALFGSASKTGILATRRVCFPEEAEELGRPSLRQVQPAVSTPRFKPMSQQLAGQSFSVPEFVASNSYQLWNSNNVRGNMRAWSPMPGFSTAAPWSPSRSPSPGQGEALVSSVNRRVTSPENVRKNKIGQLLRSDPQLHSRETDWF
jgi:hypothetical protein